MTAHKPGSGRWVHEKGKHEAPPTAHVPTWVKWLASIALLAHFFAIFTTVTSAPPGTGLPSPLAMKAFRHTLPYLHFIMLTNAYRFYAPEPGPTTLAWFRMEHQDGSVRWLEFPRKEDYWLRMPYQRRLCIPMRLDNYMIMVPGVSPVRVLNESGRILLSSYVRYLVRNYSPADNPITGVQGYLVAHRIRDPMEVRAGVEATDLRLYAYGAMNPGVYYLGAYEADGTWKAPPAASAELAAQQSMWTSFYLAETILNQDVYPLLEKHKGQDPWAVLEPLRLPTAIRKLLEQFPELLDSKTPHDPESLSQLVMSRDRTPTSP